MGATNNILFLPRHRSFSQNIKATHRIGQVELETSQDPKTVLKRLDLIIGFYTPILPRDDPC